MNDENLTIYDIASEAEVSIATVSRVLRGKDNVSPATREKVQSVMQRHNYRPSSVARGLASRVTHSLGIVLPRLSNPHYATIYTGAQEAARRNGYMLSLFSPSVLAGDRPEPVMPLVERRLDGAIVCVEYLPKDESRQLFRVLEDLKRYMPVVLIGCVPDELDFPAVTYNHAAMTRSIVEYLVRLGHRRIAMIGGIEEDTDKLRRDTGYREGLAEAGIGYVPALRAYGKATAETGEKLLGQMLSVPDKALWPTAVIAMNDMVAMGCQKAARDHGLSLPQDLSIVGCDDLFCAPYLNPALTTVNLRQQETGVCAVEMLLNHENRRLTVPWELVERASCARLTQESEE